jgi:hypothetical protein
MSGMIRMIVATLLLSAAGAHGEPLCFDEAGAMYAINPNILKAIAKVESNYQTRAINWNKNGTYDFGVMQINSNWAYTIGIERWNTLGDSCSNIKTGAMILSGCMKKYGYTWNAIGCYNSQTPDKRDRYAQMVYHQLQSIERDQLKQRASAAADRNGSRGPGTAGIREDEESKATPDRIDQEPASGEQVSSVADSGVALNASARYIEGPRGL